MERTGFENQKPESSPGLDTHALLELSKPKFSKTQFITTGNEYNNNCIYFLRS